MPNVAERFGTLLKRYITIRGWTYEQTGFEVWGTDGRKAHVSGYVGGSRGKPSPQTIAKFRDALDIPQAEIDACFETAAAPSMPEGTGLPQALLENLAMRFGHENPDAPQAELERYLKDKAKEHTALKTRFDELAETENRWANQLAAAKSLIDEGQFDEADTILADAEEFQQTEHTLVEVRKQANLRAMRGHTFLLKGDADVAHSHYSTAAGMIAVFDPVDGAAWREAMAGILYAHGGRFGGDGLDYATDLYRQNLSVLTRATNPSAWAITKNNLGNALSKRAARSFGEAQISLYEQSITAFEAALEVISKDEKPTIWAAIQSNLGLSKAEKSASLNDNVALSLLEEAIEAYHKALTVRTVEDHRRYWGETKTNLASALALNAMRLSDEPGAAMFAEAVVVLRALRDVVNQFEDPDQWANVHHSLGCSLWQQGGRTPSIEGVFLCEEAVSFLEVALSIWTKVDYPLLWAMAQNNLGNAYRIQGSRTAGATGLLLLSKSVNAYEAALTIHTKTHHPIDWAMIHDNLGRLYTDMADRGDGNRSETLVSAIAAFDEALTIYDSESTEFYFRQTTAARAETAAKLAALDD